MSEDNLPKPDDPDLGIDSSDTEDGDDSILAEQYGDAA